MFSLVWFSLTHMGCKHVDVMAGGEPQRLKTVWRHTSMLFLFPLSIACTLSAFATRLHSSMALFSSLMSQAASNQLDTPSTYTDRSWRKALFLCRGLRLQDLLRNGDAEWQFCQCKYLKIVATKSSWTSTAV